MGGIESREIANRLVAARDGGCRMGEEGEGAKWDKPCYKINKFGDCNV